MSSSTLDHQQLKKNLDDALSALKDLCIAPGRIKFVEDVESMSGGYGDVLCAVLDAEKSKSPKRVALKKLRPTGGKIERMRIAVRLARELKVWSGLNHPGILPLLGYYLDDDATYAWLISPYEARGNLTQYVARANPELTLDEKIELAKDTAEALKYLHTLNPPVCHGDIKSGNVLINGNFKAVLCDFGLSTFLQDEPSGLTTTKSVKGSTRYMSPELLEEDACLSLMSDIWAWGCLLYEILEGKLPFATVKLDHAVLLRLTRGEKPASTTDLQAQVPPTLRVLMDQCWDSVPSARPAISDCLEWLYDLLQEEKTLAEEEEPLHTESPFIWMRGTDYMPTLSSDMVENLGPSFEIRLHPYLTGAPEHWNVFWTRPWRALHSLSLLAPSALSNFHWDAPATFPRLATIRIISKYSLWKINAGHSNSPYVTVRDVCKAIYDNFNTNMSKEEYDALEEAERTGVVQYYVWNREREMDELKGEGLLRGDYLRSRTEFGGLRPASKEVLHTRWHLEPTPGIFELVLKASEDWEGPMFNVVV